MPRSFRLFWSLCVVLQLLPATIFSSSSSSGSYGENSLGNYGGGFGGGSNSESAGYGSGSKSGPVTAAVETHRSVEVKPVQMDKNEQPYSPQIIDVFSQDTPVVIHFKSQSSRVLIQQTHTPGMLLYLFVAK